MSSTAPSDIAQSAAQAPKKKPSKKKKASKPKAVETDKDGAGVENDEADEEPPTPVTTQKEPPTPTDAEKPETNGNGHISSGPNGHAAGSDTAAKLDALTSERAALRDEVEQLRKQLETLSASHTTEVTSLKTDLEESEAAKDRAEAQYQTLLGRVGQIKETLGDRLKRDRQELEEANGRVEELEAANEALQAEAKSLEGDAGRLRDELQEANRELTGLRSRGLLSQQNFHKEKEDLEKLVVNLRRELESASGAMGEWEVIALEERAVRENLTERVGDLEEQLSSAREAHERAAAERDAQSRAVDGLQRALQEIQEARKRELREMVEEAEETAGQLRRKAQEAEGRAAEAEKARGVLEAEVGRTAPFEKEVKEKNLLIGKLRHEAIILNDHLTKALKYIKKNKPEENVDRQVVTNHFLQFLALDRSDPKKFQILQIIAGLLSWSDEQREQAGLARPGAAASGGSLRLPSSPFHRTPSTPSLGAEFFSEPTPTSAKESLADLWAGFLERSVEEASGEGPPKSRTDSVSSGATGGGGGRPDTRG